jgi:hypothetical protein
MSPADVSRLEAHLRKVHQESESTCATPRKQRPGMKHCADTNLHSGNFIAKHIDDADIMWFASLQDHADALGRGRNEVAPSVEDCGRSPRFLQVRTKQYLKPREWRK